MDEGTPGPDGTPAEPPPESASPMPWQVSSTTAQPGLLQAEPSARRKGRSITAGITVLVVLALVGFLTFGRTGGTAIALSFSKGKSFNYHMHVSANMTMTEGVSSIPLDFDVSEDLTWKVESVDAAGTATILMTPSNVTATSGGTPLSFDVPSMTITITSDGRVSMPNGLTLGTGSATGPMSSGANMAAVLPSGSVKPGDSWTKTITENVFGDQVSFSSHSIYVQNQKVGSTSTAVVRTTSTVPLHLTIDLSKLFGAINAPSDSGVATGIPSGTTATYSGRVSSTTTSWVDPGSGSILKTSSQGAFSFTVSVNGLGSATGPFSARGSLSVSMTRN